MSSDFTNQGYPTTLLQRAKSKVDSLTQDSLLQPRPSTTSETYKIPFVTTFHPHVSRIYKILKNNWPILSSTSNIFNDSPLLSFRRNPNLRNLLVRSKFSNSEEIPGTFQCHRARCLTCEHTSSTTSVHGPKGHHNIKNTFTCISSNIVYALQCLQCGKLYIGETKRRLGDRFTEHRRDIIKNRSTSPVAQHFNLRSHSLDDISVLGLMQCSSDAQRKRQEMRLIHQLGTLDPSGLNVDFTFNV
jgi:hypothetical protein